MEIEQALYRVETRADQVVTELARFAMEPREKTLAGLRDGDGRRKLARDERFAKGVSEVDTVGVEGLAEQKIQLGARGVGEARMMSVGFDPEACGEGNSGGGPAGEGQRRKVAHEASDEEGDDTESDGLARLALGDDAQLTPESQVVAARDDVAAKFEEMGGAGVLTGEVFVEVQALAEEEVDGIEDRRG